MDQITVRKFKDEDAIKVGNVIERSLRLALEKQDVPQKAVREILARRLPTYNKKNFGKLAAERTFFVAEDVKSNRILGLVALKDNELRTFYVDPRHQGKGICRFLFNRLKKEALRRGYKKIIAKSNQLSEPIYKSLGFNPIRKEWHEDNGRRYYQVWMEQVIKPPS